MIASMTPDRVTPSERVSRMQSLREAAQATRFIGLMFALMGVVTAIVISATDGKMLVVAAVSIFLITPGVLYFLSGYFLLKRHYWAWLATTIMTYALFAPMSVTTIVGLITSPLPALLGGACWGWALALILKSLWKCLPAVREAETTAQHGFAVIPVAQIAPVVKVEDDQPQ